MDGQNKPIVQLSGLNGNAFVIMGACKKAARKAKWSDEKTKGMIDKMMTSDYNNLLVVAMKYFDVQ